jgi:imidazolonepropionase-like amidohydrolase
MGLTRRRFLLWSAAATVAACEPRLDPSLSPRATAILTPPATAPAATAAPSPAPSAIAGRAGRTLFRDGALTDARSDRLQRGVSILVEDGTVRWIRPSDGEEDPGPPDGLELVDASGATFVPGMVDAHSHVTLPGGAHWIDRIGDPPAALLEVAERNGRLLTSAGVRWARDVGAPYVEDPVDGRRRALSLGVRDRWRGQLGYPHVRAGGTWLDKAGTLPAATHTVASRTAEQLLDNAVGQLDDGVDFLKLYLDGPDGNASAWTAAQISPVVEAAQARGIRVTAHSANLAGAREGVRGGVDAIEHGFQLDAGIAAEMAERGTYLVSTLAVMESWLTFGRTTTLPFFAGRQAILARKEQAIDSLSHARRAGVRIATGTDFGGGSLRANQLAWEVETLVGAGLEPWEALAAATWRGGELLGEPDAGVIREGGPADFFLVHGDPLSDPASLWRVWRVAWAG